MVLPPIKIAFIFVKERKIKETWACISRMKGGGGKVGKMVGFKTGGMTDGGDVI